MYTRVYLCILIVYSCYLCILLRILMYTCVYYTRYTVNSSELCIAFVCGYCVYQYTGEVVLIIGLKLSHISTLWILKPRTPRRAVADPSLKMVSPDPTLSRDERPGEARRLGTTRRPTD